MVGTEWKNLPASVKQHWEDRASRQNEEAAAARREMMEELNAASNSGSPIPTDGAGLPGHTYECLWDHCDYQFEDPADCMEHCLHDSTGHVQRTAIARGNGGEAEYVCLWRNCIRMKKNMQAFPSLMRLVKHVRDVHLSKGGKIIASADRSKNYVPRKHKQVTINIQGTANASPQAMQMGSHVSPRAGAAGSANNNMDNAAHQQIQYQQPQYIGPPPEPMFITVPPRPQKVLHSEAYIKYIESLQSNNYSAAQAQASWRKIIKPATPAAVGSRILPKQWLGQYAEGNADDVVQALCHLRNFMVDDVLQIQRSCY